MTVLPIDSDYSGRFSTYIENCPQFSGMSLVRTTPHKVTLVKRRRRPNDTTVPPATPLGDNVAHA